MLINLFKYFESYDEPFPGLTRPHGGQVLGRATVCHDVHAASNLLMANRTHFIFDVCCEYVVRAGML